MIECSCPFLTTSSEKNLANKSSRDFAAGPVKIAPDSQKYSLSLMQKLLSSEKALKMRFGIMLAKETRERAKHFFLPSSERVVQNSSCIWFFDFERSCLLT